MTLLDRGAASRARELDVPPLDVTVPRAPADEDARYGLAETWGLASPIRRIVDGLAG